MKKPARHNLLQRKLGIEWLEQRALMTALVSATIAPSDQTNYITTSDVKALLDRASAASNNESAIIAVVDRNGDILGVREEVGVSANVTANTITNIFAIDGAVAVARTAAFFSSNQAPLTSRTVGFISQTTITQREVQSTPDNTSLSSTTRGPGFVAAIGPGGNFPPGIANTPSADLFGIEYTNRDSLIGPGANGVVAVGAGNNVPLPNQNRFNVPTADVGMASFMSSMVANTSPESYGYYAYPASSQYHFTQSRGIGTLPGGVPLYKNGVLVGGIGVFFPGTYGYADYEQGFVAGAGQSYSVRTDTTLEQQAEFMAAAAAGGSTVLNAPLHMTINGAPAVPGYDISPSGVTNPVINMGGITLPAVGPGNPYQAIQVAARFGLSSANLSGGHVNGVNKPVDTLGDTALTGKPVPYGWLVVPHTTSASTLTKAQIIAIIQQGVNEASIDRAAIRQLGSTASMVIAVSDKDGNILGLYRMEDATIFSIQVAVAKARNMAYVDDPSGPTGVLPIDLVPGLSNQVAITNRTIRYLALPYFPDGINGSPPGPDSSLNDPGINPITAEDVGPALAASVYSNPTTASLLAFTAFNAARNLHETADMDNQSGVVFFPGSSGLFVGSSTVGGLGASGDGVDQDDLVSSVAGANFDPPGNRRADQFSIHGVRLPYMEFPANPHHL